MSGKGHTTLTSAFNIMGTAFGLEVPSFLTEAHVDRLWTRHIGASLLQFQFLC